MDVDPRERLVKRAVANSSLTRLTHIKPGDRKLDLQTVLECETHTNEELQTMKHPDIPSTTGTTLPQHAQQAALKVSNTHSVVKQRYTC